MEKQKILIVAGEPSGDLHAGYLVSFIKKFDNFEFFGLGGKNLRNQGVKIYFDIKDLAVLGFWEVIKKLPKFRKIFLNLLEIIDTEKPRFAILVDYPGFNLRLVRELKKRNITIIYYISPQVWAWKSSRIKTIKESVDLMVVFFKFEEEIYKKENIPVLYLGHPLLEIVKPKFSREEIYKKFNLPQTKYTISLLPGSRSQEVKKILPIMLKTARILYKYLHDIKFLILKAPLVNEEIFKNILKNYKIPVYLLNNFTYEGLSISDFAMVASGTATLETAILEVPMVIIYKLSFFSWLYLRPLIKIPFIGMVNLVAKRKIVPEFIQYNAKPKKIAQYIKNVLTDEELLYKIKHELKEVKLNLGNLPVLEKIASALFNFIKDENKPNKNLCRTN